MIQDIGVGRYHNEYKPGAVPTDSSYVLSYTGREILVRKDGDAISFPTYQEVKTLFPKLADHYRYLFSIDEDMYFLIEGLQVEKIEGASWQGLELLRTTGSRTQAFAGVTGHQLWDWYDSRKICPRCGKPMKHSEKERMMQCPACNLMEYPKISPAVIVGVTKGDQILLTKYAGRGYTRYALIAGFAEIGETIEETVHREVMEEVGLRVKNIRYYKSQPWSYSSTLLMGFYAELDGSDEIRLDEEELAIAEWHGRDDIPEDDGVSLTREMMRMFREGKEPQN